MSSFGNNINTSIKVQGTYSQKYTSYVNKYQKYIFFFETCAAALNFGKFI